MTADVTHKTPRWVRVVLILSLGANLAVAGMVAGAFLGHEPGRKGPPIFGPTGVGFYARAMTGDERHALATDLRAQRDVLVEGRRALRQHVTDITAILRADPLDKAALQDAMTAQIDRARTQVGLGSASMVRLVEGMSVEERKDFADRLEAVMNRRPPPRR